MERSESAKSSHKEVSYQSNSEHRDEACSRCKHFVDTDPARCETVASPIEAKGWCERFEVDPGKLTHAEYREYREEGGGKEMDEDAIESAEYRDSREGEEGEIL